MVEIKFDYNQQITVIQTKLDEPFKNQSINIYKNHYLIQIMLSLLQMVDK